MLILLQILLAVARVSARGASNSNSDQNNNNENMDDRNSDSFTSLLGGQPFTIRVQLQSKEWIKKPPPFITRVQRFATRVQP